MRSVVILLRVAGLLFLAALAAGVLAVAVAVVMLMTAAGPG